MSRYYTIVLELEKTLSKKELPGWLKDKSDSIEIEDDYAYINWKLTDNMSMQEAVKKLLNETKCSRAMTILSDDTEEHGNFTLYKITKKTGLSAYLPFLSDKKLEEIENLSCPLSGVDADFGGVFGEDIRKPEEYFRQEHDFRLEYYNFGGLTGD